MSEYIYFTEEQKERANAVDIIDILHREGEQVERAGREWRWKRHHSVTIRGNSWYRHSERTGSYAIDFMQEFFGMSFPEAVSYLLDGENGVVIPKGSNPEDYQRQILDGNVKGEKAKEFELPQKNDTMRRVYAYLMKQRFIDRAVISFFAEQGTLYESKEYHNAVFVGVDAKGKAKHAHLKGTYSSGNGFRINVEGSNPAYGFGHRGAGKKLYVFEAPIDLLSFLTLYPKDWQNQNYITLNGVAEHAMLQMLKDNPNIEDVVLCLDHDAPGIENCGRLAEILYKNGYKKVSRLQAEYKDWNEDLKAVNEIEPIPAEEHPKLLECQSWKQVLVEVCDGIDEKYANKEFFQRYYRDFMQDVDKINLNEIKVSKQIELLKDAIDSHGMLLSGICIRIAEEYSKVLGKKITSEDIINRMCKRYYPHKDKGNIKSRIEQLQLQYTEIVQLLTELDNTMKYGTESKTVSESETDSNLKFHTVVDHDLFYQIIRKNMSFAMECVKAHIFVSVDLKEQMEKQHQERGMSQVCNQ